MDRRGREVRPVSELRVLLGIVEVGGVQETAEALGIAETTVKTHLRRLYAKTGTSRQADLVKLVARVLQSARRVSRRSRRRLG